MPESSQCASCKHFHGLKSCEAFPDGIPQAILSGEFDHSQKWPDQKNNILFESGKPNILDFIKE